MQKKANQTNFVFMAGRGTRQLAKRLFIWNSSAAVYTTCLHSCTFFLSWPKTKALKAISSGLRTRLCGSVVKDYSQKLRI